jgi:ABC-type branched-subunit amino acid transport system permease subunit
MARSCAAVDNSKSRCVGSNVNILFTGTFIIGCALTGLGGAVGAQILSLEPSYALKYVVLFLVVVIVGGEGSFKGSFIAAIALGIIDTLGKYFVTQAAPYLLYAAVFVLLLVAAAGLTREGGRLMTALSQDEPVAAPPARAGAMTSGRGWLALVRHALPWAIIVFISRLAVTSASARKC